VVRHSGDRNGAPADTLIGERREFISSPYPYGQSYEDVFPAMAAFLREVTRDCNGRRLLVIGHSATRWALDVLINHQRLEDLVDAPFNWRPGWEYTIPPNLRLLTGLISKNNITCANQVGKSVTQCTVMMGDDLFRWKHGGGERRVSVRYERYLVA
jgi:hypothetical protein